MTALPLLLVHANEQAREAVYASAAKLPGKPEILEFPDLSLVLSLAGKSSELLILVNPTIEERQMAREAMDDSQKPRWSVVELGTPTGDDDQHLLPPEAWKPSVLVPMLMLARQRFSEDTIRAQHLGDLLSMERRVRHDLNSPLNAILGLTELIQDITAESHPEVKEYSHLILEAIEGMTRTLDRVGLMIRATALGEPLQMVSMQDALWSAAQRLQHPSINQVVTGESVHSMPEVRGVSNWLETVWQNLLSNAVTHTGSAPVLEIGWREHEGVLHFWVQDNGPGVPQDRQAWLFYPFENLHLNKRVKGLGLAIVQRLVTLQGGVCGYESPGTGGSRFFFTLPAQVRS